VKLFRSAEIRGGVTKEEYRKWVPGTRVKLLNAQFDLARADFPVLILLAGDDRRACDEVVGLLHEWMDARYMKTRVFVEPTALELEHPPFWSHWRALPRAGQIGLYLGGWTTATIDARLGGKLDRKGFRRGLRRIVETERTLIDSGAVVLKFWFHLSRKQHRRRGTKAVGKLLELSERAVRVTHTEPAPWLVISGSDREFRNLSVADAILAGINRRLAGKREASPVALRALPPERALAHVDLASTLERDDYRERIRAGQNRLTTLSRRAASTGQSTVVVFEGWDAAGKGGAIRRMTRAMAARNCRVVPIAAPTEEERARHYLWRFWRELPRAGRLLVYDRSWYGRVLVERVEGYASEDEWRRSYREIREFERQLVHHGIVVLKFFLHLDKDEQLRRFREREKTAYKKYKITDEDYRNREKWDDYVSAVDEMVARTHRKRAPWHLVPANDKRFARVTVLETVCDALAAALK